MVWWVVSGYGCVYETGVFIVVWDLDAALVVVVVVHVVVVVVVVVVRMPCCVESFAVAEKYRALDA